MKIFVKCPFTAKTFIILDVSSADTVESFKAKVQDQNGIPPKELHLIFGGKIIEDGHTLSDYRIQNECTLMFVRRLLAGAV